MLTMLWAIAAIYAVTLATLSVSLVLYILSPRFRQHIVTIDSPAPKRFQPKLTLVAEISRPAPATHDGRRLVA
jgi:hypothetical protein